MAPTKWSGTTSTTSYTWLDNSTTSSTASYGNNNSYVSLGKLGSFGYSSNKITPSWASSTTGYWIDDSDSYYLNYSTPKPAPQERFGKIANEYREDNYRRPEVQESLGAEASARFERLPEM